MFSVVSVFILGFCLNVCRLCDGSSVNCPGLRSPGQLKRYDSCILQMKKKKKMLVLISRILFVELSQLIAFCLLFLDI